MGADAITLEDAELAGDQADHSQASSHELSADVVDVAQPLAGLADDISVQELRETHRDPGTFPTRRAQRSAPRFKRNSAAGASGLRPS